MFCLIWWQLKKKAGDDKTHRESIYRSRRPHASDWDLRRELRNIADHLYHSRGGESFSVQITTCRNQSASFLWCLINNSEDLALYGNRLVNLFRTEQWLPDYNIRLGRKEGKNSFGFLLSEKKLATAISLIGSELVMRWYSFLSQSIDKGCRLSPGGASYNVALHYG